MQQLFNVYLNNSLVYNLVFNVLNYNFNNELKTKEFLSLLQNCLSNNLDFQTLRDYLKQNNISFTSEKERVDFKINEITSFLDSVKLDSILDFGCGNGHILNNLHKKLNISKNNSFGIDVVDYLDKSDFNYLQYTNKNTIPLEDNSIDLATSLMVLHHTEDPKHYIQEIHRVLNNKGRFIVRETDAYTLDILHFNLLMEFIFYEILFNIPVHITRNYFSKNEWISLFLNNGFRLIKEESKSIKENPFTPFYLLMEKI
jgi:ubiquinone/menaquinone biosynthesis C-methylase UbiE